MFNLLKFWLLSRRLEKIKARFKAIGENVCLSSGFDVSFPERIELGSHIYIGPGAIVAGDGGLRIEDGVIIGPRVTILTSTHRYEHADSLPYDDVTELRPVVIETNVWIGANVSIVPGVTIKEGAIIAMGTVVSKNIPVGAVAGGNPVQIIKFRDMEHYNKIKSTGRCYLDLKAKGLIRRKECVERK